MNKTKQFEIWANKKLKELQKLLLLEHFLLQPIKPTEDSEEAPYCKFHYPYQTIDIFYNKFILDKYLEGNKQKALEILTHEMCHPLTDEFYSKGFNRFTGKEDLEQSREKLTDHIANIILEHKLIKP